MAYSPKEEEVSFNPDLIQYTLKLGPTGIAYAYHKKQFKTHEFLELFRSIDVFLDFNGYVYKEQHFDSESDLYRFWVEDILKEEDFEDIGWRSNPEEIWVIRPEQNIDSVNVFVTRYGHKYHKEECAHLRRSRKELKYHVAMRKKIYTACKSCFREKKKYPFDKESFWVIFSCVFVILFALIMGISLSMIV
jgi:hypothetical protein